MSQPPSVQRTAICIDKVCKVYGPPDSGVVALHEVDLTIYDNEFFTLLGPSGCGKTTLLHLIAGFEDVTAGTIRLFGKDIVSLPPNKRPINTVFQHYALFPHMSVLENVAFGLKMKSVAADTAQARAQEMLELVQLQQFSHRMPNELSGGQQQRVAVARALAPHPKVLLLDEPLSALDLKLRQSMRDELKRIQKTTGITFIFVTHDQEEALTLSDRIAVIESGEIQQVAVPKELYEAPRNRFVAKFIGDVNLIDIEIDDMTDNGLVRVRTKSGDLIEAVPNGSGHKCGPGHVAIRPERLNVTRKGGDGILTGRVRELIYLGTDTQIIVETEGSYELTVRVQNAHQSHVDVSPGDIVHLRPDAGTVQLLAD
ncbi:MAG: ABC transporter ATP-binding protein [Paracoccaceae bacterium]|nr:ABC transporter ATP-binding protein [Paracoccaceae bacterium]MDE2912259.1 ABC transporter ATP-binding protein [Paracoccaceae bacterium]